VSPTYKDPSFHGYGEPPPLLASADVSTYLIQRPVGAGDIAELGVEIAAIQAAALAMTATGLPVKVLHTTYVPADQTCLCLMDADDAATVMEALRRAGATAARVLPALAL
jgi:hypothetical protein